MENDVKPRILDAVCQGALPYLSQVGNLRTHCVFVVALATFKLCKS